MATPSLIPTNSSRETVQIIHRVTRENRSLWYKMTVLQQPERARACGAGVKANSDRRPVDPPPVVELRIIEGASVEEGKQITFDYNANFFLYASLEHARTMAHGRVQTPAANCPPILTGVPASGMAYLDRPAEAGYFIFPDLSVRHEGTYRLTFSLFETTKEEKDFDVEPADGDLPPGVDWRMEIKTLPFSVYSAKKFPGLMESTSLSKMVADQGCRVRIRRDVRMRKRDKTSNYDRREEEYTRRRTVTPAAPEDPHGLRPRSVSNSSEHRAPYPQEPQRRPSLVDSYPSGPPPPPPAYEQNPAAARGHLSFGDPGMPQYATPRQYAPHQPLQVAPVSPTGPYTSGAQSPHIKPDTQSYGYHPARTMSQTGSSPAQAMKPDMYERRHSGAYPPSPSVYTPTEPHSRRDSYSSYPATPTVPQPPPKMHLKSQHPAPPMALSSIMSPIEAQTEPLPPPPVIPTGGKRKRELVFTQSSRPLHNGQRQIDPHNDEHRRTGITSEPDSGSYYRADGSLATTPFSRCIY